MLLLYLVKGKVKKIQFFFYNQTLYCNVVNCPSLRLKSEILFFFFFRCSVFLERSINRVKHVDKKIQLKIKRII